MKKQLVLIIYTLFLGLIFGGIIFSFLIIMSKCIEFIWHVIPEHVPIPGYTFIVCLLGGLAIGLFQRKFGILPLKLDSVLAQAKRDGTYPYNNLHIVLVATFMPLIFGGSLGPEAGLAGVIVGLCYWVSDHFKKVFGQVEHIEEIGIASVLSVVFGAPLFGIIAPMEQDNEITISKGAKSVMYLSTVAGALFSIKLLTTVFGEMEGIPRFESFDATFKEWLWFLPLVAIGILLGVLFHGSESILDIIFKKIESKRILCCIIGGLVLGLTGTFLPLAMFSGEHEMSMVMETTYPAGLLVLVCLVKIILTNLCISSGWRGGDIFPLIFSGVCMGYGIALFTGIHPVFAAMVVTASLTSFILKKPLAVALLLLMCFPVSEILFIVISAYLASAVTSIFTKKDNASTV